jgi:hypothetical protein
MSKAGYVKITPRAMSGFERVVEFSVVAPQPPCREHMRAPKSTCIPCHLRKPDNELRGGLIAFMVMRDGNLKVEPYNLDPGVIVQAPPEHLHRSYIPGADENLSDCVALSRAADRLERSLIEEYGNLSDEDRQALNTIRHIAGTARF